MDLVTHSVVLAMRGSGKTGLVMVLLEGALRAGVPVLAIDVKGDLPNLLLALPTFEASALAPWVEPAPGRNEGAGALAARLAQERPRGLGAFEIGERELADFAATTSVRVIAPGADPGELLYVLCALERRSADPVPAALSMP